MATEEVLVLVEIAEVYDADGLAAYQAQARAQLADWGGRVIARGAEPLDGTPPFRTVLVQQWPSRDRFIEWQESDAYRPLLQARRRAANLRLVIVPMS